MKKLLLTLLVIASMMFATACPFSRSDVESARRSSAKLAGISDSIGDVTVTLFNKRVITLEQKNKVADAFTKVSKAGIKFDQAVIQIEANWGENPPKPELEALFQILDDEVVTLFLAAVNEMTGIDTGPYKDLIKSFKSAILAIAKVFGKAKVAVIETKLEPL